MGNGGVASALAVCAVLCTACGGGGGWTVSQPEISAAEADFISQFCDVYRPCCAAAGRPADGESCRYTISQNSNSYLTPTYDPAAGEACLNALKAAASQPDFCADTSSRPIECDRAMGVTGTTAPGSVCRSVRDCAPSAEGHVVCIPSARIGTTTSTCEVEIRGQAGDGPCLFTVLPGNGRVLGGLLTPNPPPRAILCYVSDGLFCDATGKCAPLEPVGEACNGPSCVAGAWCRALICTPLTPAEGACDPSIGGCGDGYCDSTTSTCQPWRATGEGCNTSNQCQSGNCASQMCGAPADTLSLFCGNLS